MKHDTMLSRRAALVFGVGATQGIGAAVCRRAAQAGLWVFVVGRTQAKLDQVVRQIEQAGGQATAVVADSTQIEQVRQIFEQVHQRHVSIELVVHNVGSNQPSRFLSSSLDFFNSMWNATFLSGFHVGQVATEYMHTQGYGSILFTGASASLRGKPYFAAFTTGKSALRAYVQALSIQLKPVQIHVAHVIIDGMVDGDRINQALFGLGRWIRRSKGAGGLNIEAIAETYWMLHQQPYGSWSWELDIRPYKERF